MKQLTSHLLTPFEKHFSASTEQSGSSLHDFEAKALLFGFLIEELPPMSNIFRPCYPFETIPQSTRPVTTECH